MQDDRQDRSGEPLAGLWSRRIRHVQIAHRGARLLLARAEQADR